MAQPISAATTIPELQAIQEDLNRRVLKAEESIRSKTLNGKTISEAEAENLKKITTRYLDQIKTINEQIEKTSSEQKNRTSPLRLRTTDVQPQASTPPPIQTLASTTVQLKEKLATMKITQMDLENLHEEMADFLNEEDPADPHEYMADFLDDDSVMLDESCDPEDLAALDAWLAEEETPPTPSPSEAQQKAALSAQVIATGQRQQANHPRPRPLIPISRDTQVQETLRKGTKMVQETEQFADKTEKKQKKELAKASSQLNAAFDRSEYATELMGAAIDAACPVDEDETNALMAQIMDEHNLRTLSSLQVPVGRPKK